MIFFWLFKSKTEYKKHHSSESKKNLEKKSENESLHHLIYQSELRVTKSKVLQKSLSASDTITRGPTDNWHNWIIYNVNSLLTL